MLWREAVGDVLRGRRLRTRTTLTSLGRSSGVSPQYLSEIERGLKEPSSEILAAVAAALGIALADVAVAAARRLDGSADLVA